MVYYYYYYYYYHISVQINPCICNSWYRHFFNKSLLLLLFVVVDLLNIVITSVTLLIVDLWQYCVPCIKRLIQRTLLMVLYLDRMCQCWLHAVLWSHIGILMRHLAAEPRSTAGLLFPSQCASGTILLTQYSMVWDWPVSRAGPMLFYWIKLLYPDYSLLLFFHFSSFYWLVCGAGVFGLFGCRSPFGLSLSLALLTCFNNNNNRIFYGLGPPVQNL